MRERTVRAPPQSELGEGAQHPYSLVEHVATDRPRCGGRPSLMGGPHKEIDLI